MSDLTPPPQFGFGVIPPTSVGPRVSPEDWRLIESKIQEKAVKMTDNVEITEGVGDELVLTGGKFSPRPRLIIAEDAAALEAHYRAKFAAEQHAPIMDRDTLIDALLNTDLMQGYDWLGTGSRYPSDDEIRSEVGAAIDALLPFIGQPASPRTVTITDEMVERATLAMYESRPMNLDQDDDEWETLPEDWQEEWREGARAALRGAFPSGGVES